MRLLLAEDEQALSKALKAILEHAGYTVNAVYDGKAALDCLGTGNYDGEVLDIMMPVLDGLEVLRQLRARHRPIPDCGWATSRSTGQPMSCPRPQAASGCRAGNFRCWKCCFAARGISSRKPALWSGSGDRTAARRAA